MSIRKRVAIGLTGSAIVLGAVGATAVAVGAPAHLSSILHEAGPETPDAPEPGDTPDGPAD
jgi:hypothetical protein